MLCHGWAYSAKFAARTAGRARLLVISDSSRLTLAYMYVQSASELQWFTYVRDLTYIVRTFEDADLNSKIGEFHMIFYLQNET